jgi:hypothetical protein
VKVITAFLEAIHPLHSFLELLVGIFPPLEIVAQKVIIVKKDPSARNRVRQEHSILVLALRRLLHVLLAPLDITAKLQAILPQLANVLRDIIVPVVPRLQLNMKFFLAISPLQGPRIKQTVLLVHTT